MVGQLLRWALVLDRDLWRIFNELHRQFGAHLSQSFLVLVKVFYLFARWRGGGLAELNFCVLFEDRLMPRRALRVALHVRLDGLGDRCVFVGLHL